MNKAYDAINWKNEPSTSTAINETNLNKMDRAIDTIDNRVIDLDNGKVNKEEGKSLVSNTEIAKIKTNENAIQTHTLDKSNPHSVTKEQVGLGNVDNTSDVNKPISTAQQEEFDAINSNLDVLEFGEVAGDKNLWNIEEKTYTNSISDRENHKFQALLKLNGKFVTQKSIMENGRHELRFNIANKGLNNLTLIHSGVIVDIFFVSSDFNCDTGDYVLSFNVDGCDAAVIGGIRFNNIQLEKGTTATEYEPYIPSVKMLADEVSAQNESLGSQGLLNVFDNKFESGGIDGDGTEWNNTNFLRSVNYFKCGKTVTIKCNKNHSQLVVTFYNESGNGLGNVVLTNVSNGIFNAPSGSTKFRIQVADENITSQTVGEVLVYIDNEISQLKNDLTAYADGTKSVAKATTADSATKATQDGNGNIIADTYLRKTDSTNVLLPIGSMIMCNAKEISQYYGTWVDLGTTTITCTTGTGEDIMDVTYTTHVFNRTE